ncbi:MAG: hypothetical protein D6744_09270, partial [Planctomycetota bacterium]
VTDIAFTASGTAWVATDKGLVRIRRNGRFKVFRTTNSPLLHDWVANVAVDSNGHVWVNNTSPSLTQAALFEYDGTQWRSFRVGAELPWGAPWETLEGLLVDSADHVWVGNAVLGGVAEYDGVQWTLHGADRARMIPEAQDDAGNIWLRLGIGAGNGFYRFDGTDFTFYSSANTPLADTFVSAIGVNDDDGAVLVGNWFGQVVRTDDNGQTWAPWTQQNFQILAIEPDPRNSDIWVTTPGAVRRLDANGVWQMAFNSSNTGLPDYVTDSVMSARNGDVWFTSGFFGASKFDGKDWLNFGQHNGDQAPWPFGSSSADSVYEDSDGIVWIGSNGVGTWDGQTLTHWDFNNSSLWPGMQVIGIAEDAAGTIWIADKWAGFWRKQGNDWVQDLVLPAGMDARGLIADPQGRIWAIDRVNLYRRDPGGWTTVRTFTGVPVWCFAASPDGSIWVGTSDGFFQFDGSNWRQFTTANTPLAHDTVHAIAFRKYDGLMAVAAADFAPGSPHVHGVSIVAGDPADPANWTTYSRTNAPIPHYQMTDVGFDAHGDLWVTTVEGTVEALIGRPEDLDGDGDVDLADLAILLSDFDCTGGGCAGDVDGDGDTDLSDLAMLLANFGV